jgi:hypothetical protein
LAAATNTPDRPTQANSLLEQRIQASAGPGATNVGDRTLSADRSGVKSAQDAGGADAAGSGTRRFGMGNSTGPHGQYERGERGRRQHSAVAEQNRREHGPRERLPRHDAQVHSLTNQAISVPFFNRLKLLGGETESSESAARVSPKAPQQARIVQ